MTSDDDASGPTTRGRAPRARSARDSSSAPAEAASRTAPQAEAAATPRLPLGCRQSTSVPRPAGAASRFVSDHAPPST